MTLRTLLAVGLFSLLLLFDATSPQAGFAALAGCLLHAPGQGHA